MVFGLEYVYLGPLTMTVPQLHFIIYILKVSVIYD